MPRLRFLLFLIALLILPVISQAGTIYYVSATGSDASDGLSWASAKKTLWMVTQVAHAGDQIWVKGGYYPDFSANLNDGVHLYGSFAGTESSPAERNIDANPTIGETPYWTAMYIFSGTGDTRVDGFTLQNRQTAIFADNSRVTISNCRFLNNSTPNWTSTLTLSGGSPSVKDCRFEGNGSAATGGALFAVYTKATIQGCTFVGNYAAVHGGAVGIVGSEASLQGCSIRSCSSQVLGGGISSDTSTVAIEHSTISSNRSGHDGGGVFAQLSHIRLTQNTVDSNFSNRNGGGISTYECYDVVASGNSVTSNECAHNAAGGLSVFNGAVSGTGTVVGNVIQGNRAVGGAGGLLIWGISAQVSDNQILDNAADVAGVAVINATIRAARNRISGNVGGTNGGLYFADSSGVVESCLISRNTGSYGGGTTIIRGALVGVNNTITENTAVSAGGGIIIVGAAPTLANNIVAFNAGSGVEGVEGTDAAPTLLKNAVYGNSGGGYIGVLPGVSDLAVDPYFVNASGADYRLSPVSACIDAGYDATSPGWAGSTDLAGLSRVSHGLIDVGAFEVQGAPDRQPPVTTPTVSPEPNSAGWNKTDVTVTLTAADATRVEKIRYRMDGGAWAEKPGNSASFPITVEGIHTVEYQATDGLNVEEVKSIAVRIDKTNPALTWTGRVPNLFLVFGWYNTPVTWSWAASDTGSGLATPATGQTTTVGEGNAVAVQVTVTDIAGNNALFTSPATPIDLTPPTTAASRDPGSGKIVLTATDPLSGVLSTYYTIDGGARQTYTGMFPVTATGTHTVEFWSVDKANNIELTGQYLVENGAPKLVMETASAYIWTNQTTGEKRVEVQYMIRNKGSVTAYDIVGHDKLDDVKHELPQHLLGNLAPNQWVLVSISYPIGSFKAGQKATVSVNGTYNGGASFYLDQKVKIQ